MLYEDEMQFYTPVNAVPCRGREGRIETNVSDSFTMRELDAIAPLAPKDPSEICGYCTPDAETISRVQKRIEAARRLKYGN